MKAEERSYPRGVRWVTWTRIWVDETARSWNPAGYTEKARELNNPREVGAGPFSWRSVTAATQSAARLWGAS